MNIRFLKFICLLGAFVGLTSAGTTYTVKFYDAVRIGATELKAGDYKIEMQGDKAVFRSSKNVMVEIPATLEKGDKKFNFTSLIAEDSKINEIDVAGTNVKIVFIPVPSGVASK